MQGAFCVAIFVLADGIGVFLADKLYMSFSTRQFLNLTIVCSIIAQCMYTFAATLTLDPQSSSDAAYPEEQADRSNQIFRQIMISRFILGICHGASNLTQRVYIS